MYKTLITFIAVTLLMSGCVSLREKAIDYQSITDIKAQRVAYTLHKKPDFVAMTAGKTAFATLGYSSMTSEGNKIITENNVADPAEIIANRLIAAMQDAYNIRPVLQPIMVDKNDALKIAVDARTSTKFIIDVQTIDWGFKHFPSDRDRYGVIYIAKARLINIQDKTVVAEGFCKQIPERQERAPTYEDLLSNRAARLKSALNNAAATCTRLIKAQMFAL